MTGFEIVATRGFYHPVGRVTFEQGVELITQACCGHARWGSTTSW